VDFRDIKKIVELMDQHGLSQFKLEQDETKLELKKGGDIDMKAIQQWMASSPDLNLCMPIQGLLLRRRPPLRSSPTARFPPV
jgi:hypothetical protein